jgi:hypothetical protein
METMDERWAFLRPWTAAVSGRLAIEYDDWVIAAERQFVGISVRLKTDRETPSPSPAELRAIRDALVLLALVAHVDVGALAHVLRVQCQLELSYDDEIALDLDGFRDRDPQFVIKVEEFELGDVTERAPQMLKDLLLPDVSVANSRGLDAALCQIISQGVGGRLNVGYSRLDVPVVVNIESLLSFASINRVWPRLQRDNSQNLQTAADPAFVSRVWSGLLELKERCGGWRVPVELPPQGVSASSINCGLAVRSISVHNSKHRLKQEAAVTVMDMMTHSHGLTISEVWLWTGPNNTDEVVDDGAKALASGKLFERILCVSGCAKKDHRNVKRINLSHELGSFTDFARLSSALAETQTVESIILRVASSANIFENYTRQIQHAWKYLAYALFSRHARARSSVTSVTLHGLECLEMWEEQMDGFAEVLASADPAIELFRASGIPDHDGDGNAVIPDPGTIGMLKKGTHLTLLPMDADGFTIDWNLETDVSGVRVLQVYGDSGVSIVLVPGYGVCQVARDQVVPEAEPRLEGGVTSLHIKISNFVDNVRGLPRFLQLIGLPLTRLSLYFPSESEAWGIWTADILKSCPNLTTFVLTGPTPIDTESFLSAYRENHLKVEDLDCPFDDIGRLARELTDTNSSFAKTVKCLACRFQVTVRYDNANVALEEIASMLNANRTLEYLHMTVPSGVPCDSILVEHMRSFHNQPLPVVRERFSTACRVAFISIFAWSSDQIKKREVKRARTEVPPSRAESSSQSVLVASPMDRSVLSLIFDFAASCVRRRTYLTIDNELE